MSMRVTDAMKAVADLTFALLERHVTGAFLMLRSFKTARVIDSRSERMDVKPNALSLSISSQCGPAPPQPGLASHAWEMGSWGFSVPSVESSVRSGLSASTLWHLGRDTERLGDAIFGQSVCRNGESSIITSGRYNFFLTSNSLAA